MFDEISTLEDLGAPDDLEITPRPIRALKSYRNNPRTHTFKQIRQIMASIREFGFTAPILIDSDNCIIAGHGRARAAKELGLDQVPTITLNNLSDEQIRAYVIADNRLAENAGWDKEMLAIELQNLSEFEINFDITVTGFEAPEIEILIDGLNGKQDDTAADQVPDLNLDTAAVTWSPTGRAYMVRHHPKG